MRVLTAHAAPLCVLLLALLSFGIGLAELPVQDRDEARFAQAARQMAATGDLIDIRLQDAPRHNKPALIYWAQAAAIALTGVSGETPIWVHRLPSYLAGALSALALIWAGTPLIGRRAAIVAGIICATIYMLHAEARTAKTDAALLLSVVVAMGALARLWLEPRRQRLMPLILWTALAAGFLLKGPMILLPVAGAIIWTSVQFRDAAWLRRLRPLPGVLWFCLLVAPWFIAISLVTDGAFWAASVGGDLSDKITADGEHAGSPPGFYLLTVWLTFFPWSMLIPPALMLAWQIRRDPKTAFILGWLIPGWLVFEAVPVKLIHYTLPLFPALMLLVAAVIRPVEGDAALRRWSLGAGTFGWSIALTFFATVAFMAPVSYGDGVDAWASIGTLTFSVAGLAGVVWVWRGALPKATAALALSGMTLGWTLTAASLPAARSFWIADQLVNATASHECLAGPIALAGYAEPSAVFRLGTDTILTDSEGALAYLEGGENRAAWIDPAAMAAVEGGIRVEGISIGNFRPVTLQLYVSPGVPAPAGPCAR
jgi:4-amino-4-deoxy-L-arabinose transferase-like glycosyltransferase